MVFNQTQNYKMCYYGPATYANMTKHSKRLYVPHDAWNRCTNNDKDKKRDSLSKKIKWNTHKRMWICTNM